MAPLERACHVTVGRGAGASRRRGGPGCLLPRAGPALRFGRRPAGPQVRSVPSGRTSFRTVDGEDTSAGTPGDARERVERRRPVEAGRPTADDDLDLGPLEAVLGRRRAPAPSPPSADATSPRAPLVRPRRSRRTTHARAPPGGGRGHPRPGCACVAAPVQPTGVGSDRRAGALRLRDGHDPGRGPGPPRHLDHPGHRGGAAVAVRALVRRRVGVAWRWPWSPPSCPAAAWSARSSRRSRRPGPAARRARSGSPAPPLCASGSRCCRCSCPATGRRRGRSRERMHRIATAAVLVVLIGIVVFALAVWWASHSLSTRVDVGRERAVRAARRARGTEAALELRQRRRARSDRPHTLLGGWWTFPAHLVPLVSQQLEGLSVASGEGHADRRGRRGVRGQGRLPRARASRTGQIDLARRASSSTAPLARINQVLPGADRHISSVRSPWLVGPVRTRARPLQHPDRRRRCPRPRWPSRPWRWRPAMLGGHGTRHYFVAFTTESESRGLNGFMGNWAELTASDGKLTLTRTGRVDDLNARPGDRLTRVVHRPARVRRPLRAVQGRAATSRTSRCRPTCPTSPR